MKYYAYGVLLLVISAPLSWGTTVLISIDNTGANSPVSSGSPRIWNFQVTQQLVVSKSMFGLNDGVNTTADITFKLWNDFGGTGDALRTITLTAAQVDNSFATQEVFDFGDIILEPGNYSASLTSPAGSGNQSYFLKNGSLALFLDDGTGSKAASSLWTPDTNIDGTAGTTFTPANLSAVPEPDSLVLLGGLLVSVGFLRSRRILGMIPADSASK
jgi:hypothetical protein